MPWLLWEIFYRMFPWLCLALVLFCISLNHPQKPLWASVWQRRDVPGKRDGDEVLEPEGCTVQGFSLLDLFPAGLRAAKNPKRRRRRRKRTGKRRNTRKRRRRTRRSIPRRMLPHHPRILPRIGIRGSWAGLGPQQCKTGGRIQDSPVVTAGSSAGISWLSKIPFPPAESLYWSPLYPCCPRRHHRRKTPQPSEAARHGRRRHRADSGAGSSSSGSDRSPARRRSRSRDGRGRHPSPRRRGRKRSRSRSPPARGLRQRHDTDSED